MKTILKFTLKMDASYQDIEMPKNAKIIHTAEQFGLPCIWAEVNTQNELEFRKFRFDPTGFETNEIYGVHVGSFLLEDGRFVLHLYEI